MHNDTILVYRGLYLHAAAVDPRKGTSLGPVAASGLAFLRLCLSPRRMRSEGFLHGSRIGP